tara:strand:- start:1138 stop:1908 length:771 start_codon:yes stop_codon:yes gene_type:complete
MAKELITPESTNHWYKPDGEPAYGATLREARKQYLFPSVTEVIKVMASPGLEAWKQTMLVTSALTIPDDEKSDDLDALAKQIIAESRKPAMDAAKRGTEVHNGAEAILWDNKWDTEDAWLNEVYNWVQSNVLSVKWTEKSLVNSELGYAGKADALIDHQEHGLCLIDWKTSNLKRSGKKNEYKPRFYEKWLLQLAAYRECLDTNPHVVSVIINSNEPQIFEKVWSDEEVDEAYDIFVNLFHTWCWTKKYNPIPKSA